MPRQPSRRRWDGDGGGGGDDDDGAAARQLHGARRSAPPQTSRDEEASQGGGGVVQRCKLDPRRLEYESARFQKFNLMKTNVLFQLEPGFSENASPLPQGGRGAAAHEGKAAARYKYIFIFINV